METLSLALSDADLLLLQTPSTRLAAPLESARFRLQRRAFGHAVRLLRAKQAVLHRDGSMRHLHWAWLHADTTGNARQMTN